MDAKHTLGEPRVLISRKALLHNAGILRARLMAGVKLCATIKADAYGHGAAIVADTLCNCARDGMDRPPADALAVASLDEAAALTSAVDLRVPILIFRPLENAFVGRQRLKIEEAIRRDWVLTTCTPAAAEDVARIAQSAGRASIQLMIDTGMTRSGVSIERLDAMLRKIESRPALRLAGLCTHFAASEDPADSFTAEQLERFRYATDTYATSRRILRHAANSAAVFHLPESHLDMVRPGIALFGIDAIGRPHLDRHLKPVLRWTAPLVAINDIPAGTTVGYNRTWKATRPTRVGLVPIGYADGYPRSFSNRASVIIQGQAVPVIGRVSMDLATIDLTDVHHPTIGDEITLLDNDPLSPASAYNLARWADTIPYEIFCGIGQRIHRVAMDEEDASAPADLAAAEEE